jgi:hypothetical protein
MTTFEGSPQADLAPSVAHAAPLAVESVEFVDFISGPASNVAAAAKIAIEAGMDFTCH